MNKQIRKHAMLSVLFILGLLCIYLVSHLGIISDRVIRLGTFILPVNSFQGVVSGLCMILCTLMVFLDYKTGFVLALITVSGTLGNAAYSMLTSHSLRPLPSVATAILSFITIFVIRYFYKRSYVTSQTDMVTGLRNRRSFTQKTSELCQTKKEFAIALIEIEDFKQLNDIYGLQAGDFILCRVADKLERIIGSRGTLYKITGAIFAVIFEGDTCSTDTLEQIIQIEGMTFNIPENVMTSENCDKACKITLAIGIARHPDDSRDSITLLKYVDTALAFAKKSSTEKFLFYTKEMANEEVHQKEAEILIKKAMENNWFYLVYQPQYTLKEKKLRGFETLIRCHKPDGSIVSPAYFIPAAEKTNLILDIDAYVLRHAMIEFKDVVLSKNDALILSINVSAKNISSDNFANRIKTLLNETKFPAHNLEIEITEYSLAESIERTTANIKSLREIGVQIALDDFGTGYTSIAQLMKLPINLLKIDKSLIDDIESNQMNRDLVDSVIYMGHTMNCEVISEGVETEKQLSVLNEHNCDFIQGFVWGKPMAFSDAVELSQKNA